MGFQGVGRDAGHRDFQVFAQVAGSEGNFQFPSRQMGVIVESFVEIAQPEQQQSVRVGMFDFQILAAYRRYHYPP